MTDDDVLALFPPLRQASIVRLYLTGEFRVAPGPSWDGTFRYRSPAEVREAVASDVRYIRDNAKRLFQSPWRSCAKVVGQNRRDRARSGWRAEYFTKLANAFGSRCWACEQNEACYIDHDHFTGEVRGLLCSVCNPSIDGCLHVDGAECFAARYLNAAPRYPGLRYRPANEVRASDRTRCLIVGFNLFDQRCWPSPIPVEWEWIPPPPDSLKHVQSSPLREFRAEWATA